MFADDSDTSDLSFDPGPKHSTPVKADTDGRQNGTLPVMSTNTRLERIHRGPQASRLPGSSSNAVQSAQQPCGQRDSRGIPPPRQTMAHKELDSLVMQQRKEITSLIAELHERDRELNDLVTSHQHQLSVWEQDRQLILRLQHKCQRLAAEVKQQKKRHVRSPGETRTAEDRRGHSVHSRSSSHSDESSLHLQQLQNHNDNLNDSLKEATKAKGQLQAREQELTTLLKLKEDSLAEAERTVGELRSQVKNLQVEKEESQMQAQTTMSTWQQHCHSLKEDKDRLVHACQEKDRQLQQATAQLQDTLQQALVLQQALSISCEGEKNKEEMLKSLRARQERLNQELNQLRNLYKRQNREMTLLQLTVDTSIESDPDSGDHDRQAAPIFVTANSSLKGASDSLSLLSSTHPSHAGSHPSHAGSHPSHAASHPSHAAETQRHQHGYCANIMATSDTSYTHTSYNNMDNNSDHNNTASAAQQCSYAASQQSDRSSRGSGLREHKPHNANVSDTSVRSRSSACEEYGNLNTNNSSSVSAPHGQWCMERHISPSQSAQETCQEPALQVQQDHQSLSLQQDHQSLSLQDHQSLSLQQDHQSPSFHADEGDDAASREQDVDTEMFWQKILSVRHGNQNSMQDSKHWTHPPVKNCLDDVHTESKEAGHYLTDSDNGTHVTQEGGGSSPQWHKPSPHDSCAAVPTGAGSGPDRLRIGASRIPRRLPSNVPPAKVSTVVMKVLNRRPLHRAGLMGIRETGPGKCLHQVTLLTCLCHTRSLRGQGWEHAPGSSDSKMSASPGQHILQPHKSEPADNTGAKDNQFCESDTWVKGQCGEGNTWVKGQFGEGDTSPDSALAASLQFDEKLSSFLESPEDDTSFEAVAASGHCSPASKLHRLLMESQEMIKALEIQVLPDHG